MGTPPSNIHTVFAGRRDWALREREAELALVDELVAVARRGRGAVLLVEGPAGIGKTRLLGSAVDRAAGAGLRVLAARAGQLERAFAYGVVRQLYEPVVAGAGPTDRASLLAGAAGLAAPLVDPTAPAGEADLSFGALHGLFWLTANLAERGPLLLALDDLHWCDAPSLRFLLYLARRLEGLPVVLVATLRPDEPGAETGLLGELGADPLALVARPAPLSPDAVGALVAEALGPPDPALVAAAAALADALLERGEPSAATAAIASAGIGEEVPGTFPLNLFLHTRGWVRVVRGERREGLRDLRAVGERLEALGMRNPAQVPWRSRAALALRTLGEPGEARRLAAEEVELARTWGAPRALGVALLAQGLVEDGPAATARLREAVAVLEGSAAVLELARALTELGAALRRTNHRSEARAFLGRALELASRCGGLALAERSHAELVAAGARPRRIARTGPDALTPSERRVAGLAADGQTNREIAQALFVTPRAIEAHLSNVYRKLEIGSRSQLARALGPTAPVRAAVPAPGRARPASSGAGSD
jgi:DNA-binding CsgD family transcriptional regulator